MGGATRSVTPLVPVSSVADLDELVKMLGVAEFAPAKRGDHAAIDDENPVAEQDQLAEVGRRDQHAGAASAGPPRTRP